MNETTRVCLDRVTYRTKPDSGEAGRISARLAKKDRVHVISSTEDFNRFAELVGENEGTFSPATYYNESRSVADFEQMQLLTLDFDGGMSLNEVMDRTSKYNVRPFMAYETLSSEGQNKFRVMFKNDSSINDGRLAKITLNGLLTMFPEADRKCDDISRMFYGGKGLLFYDKSLPTVNPESILRNMTYYLKERRGLHHYKEHIKRFARKHGIRVTSKGHLDISIDNQSIEDIGMSSSSGSSNSSNVSKDGKNLPSAILLLSGDGRDLPKSQYRLALDDGDTKCSVDKNAPRNRKVYRSDCLSELRECCRLFGEFESGQKWLYHDELFGLSTNLIQIEGGADRFKGILSQHTDYYDKDKQDSFDFYIRYIKEQNYNPQGCEFFCPYKDTCNHGKNILSTIKPTYGNMERVANYAEIFHFIEEVQNDLKQKLMKAIDAGDTKWHIINAQTAAGKTQAFLDVMKDSNSRFLIAVPTNKLKQDIKRRADEEGIKLMVTPSLDEIKDEMPGHVWNYICELRRTGRHKWVHSFIDRIAEEEDIKCLKKYLKQQKDYESHEGHIITTHRRFMSMGEKELK